MEEEVLMEISEFCAECPSNQSCPEGECVLYRIETIIERRGKENESKSY